MAYEKQTWKCGDEITAEKMNHMEEGIYAGAAELPIVGTADKGKVLTVGSDGTWKAEEAPDGLPSVGSSDKGKVLSVNSSGEWAASEPECCMDDATVQLESAGTDKVKPAGELTFAQMMDKKFWEMGNNESGVIASTQYVNGEYIVSILYNGKLITAKSTNGNAVPVFDTKGTDEETNVYGVEWDGTSTTKWSRTDASAEFVDPEPAVANGGGSSPFDDIMPWKGMVKVEDAEAGTLVAIPKYWYKWTREGDSMKLQIANGAADGFLVSPAHADRGDGKGERDVVYVGRYHCSDVDYKSTTGVMPKGNVTRDGFRTAIHALGDDIWQYDFAMYWTIAMLYLVEFADWNSQAVIGYGCGTTNSKANEGATDAMQYHTGTNAATRTTYGEVQYRNIEGLWSNVFDWCDGIYFSGSDVFCIKNPANFSDTTGGTNVGTRATSSNYISKFTAPEVQGFEYALYPNEVTGSDSTYVCDYCYYGSSGVVLRVGGNYGSHGQGHGLFYLYGNHAASYSYADVGSRLQKLP